MGRYRICWEWRTFLYWISGLLFPTLYNFLYCSYNPILFRKIQRSRISKASSNNIWLCSICGLYEVFPNTPFRLHLGKFEPYTLQCWHRSMESGVWNERVFLFLGWFLPIFGHLYYQLLQRWVFSPCSVFILEPKGEESWLTIFYSHSLFLN